MLDYSDFLKDLKISLEIQWWEQASLGPQTLLRLGSSWQVCLSIGMTMYEAVLLYLYPYGLLALQEKTDLKTLVS